MKKKIWKWPSNICWTLNTHCRVWDNFWQLKALEHNENLFLFYLRNYFRFWEVFIFLSWFFVYVEEVLDKKVMIVFKIHGSTNWRANNCNSCLPNISKSKGSPAMNFGQLTKFNMRKIFLQNSCRKWGRKTSSRPLFFFFKKKGFV